MDSEKETERRRDSALRRALAMARNPRKSEQPVSVELHADGSAVLALVDALNRAVQIAERRIDLPHLVEELVTLQIYSDATAAATELCVRFDPTDRFRGFVAALGAGNLDVGTVEHGSALQRSTEPLDPNRGNA
jgi:hypothetical protein